MNRLSILRKYLEEDPSDPFNIYALALELLKSDRQQAKTYFDELIAKHPQYIPTYYHAAKLYESLDQREDAIKIYERGILAAKETGDNKAMRELRSSLDELQFE